MSPGVLLRIPSGVPPEIRHTGTLSSQYGNSARSFCGNFCKNSYGNSSVASGIHPGVPIRIPPADSMGFSRGLLMEIAKGVCIETLRGVPMEIPPEILMCISS